MTIFDVPNMDEATAWERARATLELYPLLNADVTVLDEPQDGAGVVVIDLTLSDNAGKEDVLNACFGEDGWTVKSQKMVAVRNGGMFRPGAGTRVSAVVSFSRHPMHWEHGYELEIFHNPFAKVPIPEDMFRFPGIEHVRRVEESDGSFWFDTLKPDETR